MSVSEQFNPTETLLEAIMSRTNSMSTRYSQMHNEPEESVEDDYRAINKRDLGVESHDDTSISLTHHVDNLLDGSVEYDYSQPLDDEELHVLPGHDKHIYPTRQAQHSSKIKTDDNPQESYSMDSYTENIHDNDKHSNHRRYQHPLAKPIKEAGNIRLGIGKAKLYGLLDENGGIKLPINPILNTSEIVKKNINAKSKVDELHTRKEIDIEAITADDEKHTFLPSRTKEAERAMRDPRCGYDFISRLKSENGSSVLERLTLNSNSKGMSKSALEALEDDYNAKIDKLACPKCRKPQSFDEFMDKRRICGQCNQRFIKLNVTSGAGFMKKLEDHEKKRQQKMSTIEEDMYGEMERKREAFKGKPLPQFIIKDNIERKKAIESLSTNQGSQLNKNQGIQKDTKIDDTPTTAIFKMAAVNATNNSLLKEAIRQAEKKYPSTTIPSNSIKSNHKLKPTSR